MCLHSLALAHWGRVTHICDSKLVIIGWDNGLSPGRRQAIISTNAGILLMWPFGTNFSEILIGIHIPSFKKMVSKMLSPKCRPFCLGLNVLGHWYSKDFASCMILSLILTHVQFFSRSEILLKLLYLGKAIYTHENNSLINIYIYFFNYIVIICCLYYYFHKLCVDSVTWSW